MLNSLSSNDEKKEGCRSFRLCSEKSTEKIEAPRRPVVQPNDNDRVRIETRPAVHFT